MGGWGARLVLVVLVTAGCPSRALRKTLSPEVPYDGQEAEPGEVVLLAPGAEPWRVVSYAAGKPNGWVLPVEATIEADGGRVRAFMVEDVRTKWTSSLLLTTWSIEGSDGPTALEGSVVECVMDRSGAVTGQRVRASTSAAALVGTLAGALCSPALAMPAAPIGVGARWQVRTRTSSWSVSLEALAPPYARRIIEGVGETEDDLRGFRRRLSLGAVRTRMLPLGCAPGRAAIPGSKTSTAARTQGALDKAAVGAAVKQRVPAFRRCYQSRLRGEPFPEGRVVVHFVIDAGGVVEDACIADTELHEPATEACVLGVMSAIRFPRPRNGGTVIVTYPFLFALAP